ncbi:hypothetical protein [Streptomyces sp. NPDC001070]
MITSPATVPAAVALLAVPALLRTGCGSDPASASDGRAEQNRASAGPRGRGVPSVIACGSQLVAGCTG